jgi:hypothetical protein
MIHSEKKLFKFGKGGGAAEACHVLKTRSSFSFGNVNRKEIIWIHNNSYRKYWNNALALYSGSLKVKSVSIGTGTVLQ